MTEPDFDAIQPLLLAALDRPASDRAAFVRLEAGEDEALAREVLELLNVEAQQTPRLDTAAMNRALRSGLSAEGRTLGPYAIVERIGSGGMGEVYRAEQTQPVRRTVALKLIKPGLDTREALARFDAERRSLALLKHPNIAHVFDAGSTPEGRPYFVMEYVDGDSITAYADRERSSLASRIRLVIQACRAVQHAHQRGIIHRDLKPSNLLVETQDGQPQLKIIDFGVAKAVDPERLRQTSGASTEVGQLVGTPEYMSPEQANPVVEDIDSRTDIYALGAVSFELLTGLRPWAGAAGSDIPSLLSAIRDQPTPRPLQALIAASADTREAVAEARGLPFAHLRRSLRGELEWIILKAMAKDREHRYDSAAELAADLERYLEDQPVLASPPSRLYPVRKFIERHAAGVGTGLLVFAIIQPPDRG